MDFHKFDGGDLGLGVCAIASCGLTKAVIATPPNKTTRTIQVPLDVWPARLREGLRKGDAGSINRRTVRPAPLVGSRVARRTGW